MTWLGAVILLIFSFMAGRAWGRGEKTLVLIPSIPALVIFVSEISLANKRRKREK
jgi:hypothetical protein